MDFALRNLNSEATESYAFKSKKHDITSSEQISIKTNGVAAKMDNKNLQIS